MVKRKSPLVLRAAAALLTAALLAGIALAATSGAPDRSVIFSHTQHAETGLECAACHTPALSSTTGRDNLLPGHPQCSDCHDVQAAGGCSMCHTGDTPQAGARITAYSPLFSHERHRSAARLECAACHTGLDEPLAPEQAGHLPRMAECMQCHTARNAANECRTCHAPGEDLQPADHKLDWLTLHGAAAATEDACTQCHQTDACLKCHNGDPLFMPHPRDYISRHGTEARLSDVSCSVCHADRGFCVSCHRDMHVLPVDHFRPGWVTADGGGHGEQAQFDLESCIACHDVPNQQPLCARCHTK